MKNIVKVLRFKDNATRLYQLPACYDALDNGTVVEVEFGSGTALGVTVSASYCGDYEEMMRDLFNVLPGKEFKHVVAVYDRNEVDWTATDASAAEDAADGAQEDTAEDVQEG